MSSLAHRWGILPYLVATCNILGLPGSKTEVPCCSRSIHTAGRIPIDGTSCMLPQKYAVPVVSSEYLRSLALENKTQHKNTQVFNADGQQESCHTCWVVAAAEAPD